MDPLVTVDIAAPGIASVTLNDPDKRNAMSEEMGESFARVIADLRAQPALRVVVIGGAGESFSAGGHLEMLFEKTKLSEEENRRRMETFYAQFLSVLALDVPVVAALNGHAVGAGLCLALACDIRLMAETAKCGLNFVNLGLHPGMGATYTLPRIVGPAAAADLLLTGRIIPAHEAHRIGLVHEVFAASQFSERVAGVVDGLAAAGPQAMRALKESLRMSDGATLERCLDREARCQAQSYASAEFLEGITAARAKRKPKF